MQLQIEPVSTEHLLKNFGLAVDEAKYVRQLIKTQEMVETLKKGYQFSERLVHLRREIKYLEKKIEKVRAQAKVGSKVLKTR